MRFLYPSLLKAMIATIPESMPNPPNINERNDVSAINIPEVNLFCAPITLMVPISPVRSMAAILMVFAIISMAAKKIQLIKDHQPASNSPYKT